MDIQLMMLTHQSKCSLAIREDCNTGCRIKAESLALRYHKSSYHYSDLLSKWLNIDGRFTGPYTHVVWAKFDLQQYKMLRGWQFKNVIITRFVKCFVCATLWWWDNAQLLFKSEKKTHTDIKAHQKISNSKCKSLYEKHSHPLQRDSWEKGMLVCLFLLPFTLYLFHCLFLSKQSLGDRKQQRQMILAF